MQRVFVVIAIAGGCGGGSSAGVDAGTPPTGDGPSSTSDAPQSGATGTVLATVSSETTLSVGGGDLFFHDGTKILACNIANGCGGAARTVVTETGTTAIFDQAVVGNAVYYATSDGKIRTVATAGGSATDLATGQEATYDIAADATELYWVNNTHGGSFDDGSVVTCKIAQCAATLTTVTNGQSRASAIAIDAGHVYWAGVGNAPAAGSPAGYVRRCARGGACAAPENLQQPYRSTSIAVNATSVFFMAGAPPAPNNSYLPFSCPLAGCPSLMGTAVAGAAGKTGDGTPVVLDATNIYWTVSQIFGNSVTILRCPLAGCGSNAPEVFATYPGDRAIQGLAVDDQHVFLAAEKGSSYDIVRFDK